MSISQGHVTFEHNPKSRPKESFSSKPARSTKKRKGSLVQSATDGRLIWIVMGTSAFVLIAFISRLDFFDALEDCN